ncbi:MAG: carboxypeptidase regulatory-like domain-containing protein [Bacteroidales bacterium]|jgi:hypothetical protein|nr:TonB-dependent receptor [Bacteroidales bacterium]MDD2823687.1 TonB-dependent receptor [Bacteroidales bacterium]MDD3099982.1 TonB-dependent receptor [Bacteroidales bacterium]MDD3638738.1 TonB-dependent receptor [Bacteroidales bacterium]MDD3943483.1 TonB-dependent receptor [Bacteroidales bacterium]
MKRTLTDTCRIALVFLGFVFMTTGLKAQTGHKLSGKVIDATAGEVLPGAVVRVLDPVPAWTLTDSRGRFTMELPAGKISLEISYIGYKTRVGECFLDRDRDTLFVLTPLSYYLQDVTVFAESPGTRLRKAEMSVERIDAQVIQRVPTLFGEVDLLKVVQMLPGVQAASEGSSGFHVRGGSPDQNMILYDNATLYNVSHMLGFFSIFNSDAVGSMSLYKGDIPAPYGGRLSSLLEVTPADGKDRFSIDGGIGLISSKLAVQGRIGADNLTYLVAGRRTYADLFLPLAKNEILREATIHFYDLNGRMRWRINDNNYLNLTLYNGRDRFKISEMGVTFGNSVASVNWNHAFSDRLFLKMYTNFTNYEYDFNGKTNDLDMEWISSIQDAGMRLDFSYILNPRHLFEFGYTSNFQWFKPGQAIGKGTMGTGVEVEQDITMSPRQGFVNVLYFSNQHKLLNERVELRYGLRFNRFDNVGPTILYTVDENYNLVEEEGTLIAPGDFFHHEYGWEPRLGISVMASPVVSVKASYARTLQYVHLLSFSSAGSPMEIWIPSGPSVKPQSSHQVSAGVFANLFRKDYEASVEVFYKHLDNVLDFKEHPNLILYDKIETELRFGTGKSYGIEFLLKRNKGALSGWVSYTWSRSFRTIPGVNNGQRYRSPSDRPHNINIVVFYDISDRLQASLNWIYATGRPLTLPEGRYWFFNELIPVYTERNSYRMADYHRMDASLNIRLSKPGKRWNHSLNISVYNLYGRKNPWAINYRMNPSGEQYLEMTYLFSVVPSVTWNFTF